MVKLLKMNDDDDDDSTEKPSSAQIVASIDDLLLEIIHRLPLKPLVQLRLVSKYWNSLISDPRLCSLRNRAAVGLILQSSLNSNIIFLDKLTDPPFRMIYSFKDTWYRRCEVIHSCNGLLLCVTEPACKLSRKYYVYNLTTRKYTALPQVVFDHSTKSICGLYLAFDPSKSPHYKVVCVMRSLGGLLHLFEVYSSETLSWRKGGELFQAFTHFDFEDGGVYWNRAIHWVNIVTKPREFAYIDIDRVTYVDMDRVTKPRESVYLNLDCDDIQTPKVFPKPPLQDDKCYYKQDYYFGESCDHLHFVDSDRVVGDFKVYEMKKDYSEWFVKYKVNVPDAKIKIIRDSPFDIEEVLLNNSRDWFMVVRGKNDEDWFLVFVIVESSRIARYSLERKTCEILYDFQSRFCGDRQVVWCSKRVFQYIESHCAV